MTAHPPGQRVPTSRARMAVLLGAQRRRIAGSRCAVQETVCAKRRGGVNTSRTVVKCFRADRKPLPGSAPPWNSPSGATPVDERVAEADGAARIRVPYVQRLRSHGPVLLDADTRRGVPEQPTDSHSALAANCPCPRVGGLAQGMTLRASPPPRRSRSGGRHAPSGGPRASWPPTAVLPPAPGSAPRWKTPGMFRRPRQERDVAAPRAHAEPRHGQQPRLAAGHPPGSSGASAQQSTSARTRRRRRRG